MSLKLAASLVVSLSLLAFVFAYMQMDSEQRVMRRDLERRSAIVADALRETVEHGVTKVQNIQVRDPLVGVAEFDLHGSLVDVTPGVNPEKSAPINVGGP